MDNGLTEMQKTTQYNMRNGVMIYIANIEKARLHITVS